MPAHLSPAVDATTRGDAMYGITRRIYTLTSAGTTIATLLVVTDADGDSSVYDAGNGQRASTITAADQPGRLEPRARVPGGDDCRSLGVVRKMEDAIMLICRFYWAEKI